MDISEKQIAQLLDDCGFKHALNGYDYIIDFVKSCAEDKSLADKITAAYSIVGAKFGVSGSKFERCIRHSIEKSNLDEYTASEFFHSIIHHFKYGTEMRIKGDIQHD